MSCVSCQVSGVRCQVSSGIYTFLAAQSSSRSVLVSENYLTPLQPMRCSVGSFLRSCLVFIKQWRQSGEGLLSTRPTLSSFYTGFNHQEPLGVQNYLYSDDSESWMGSDGAGLMMTAEVGDIKYHVNICLTFRCWFFPNNFQTLLSKL